MLKTSGKFTVGFAWDFLREKQEVCLKYKYIWSAGVPFKISFFNLRLWKQRLPIGEVLIRNMMDGSSKGNPGPSSSAFCIRDDQGNLMYAEGNMIGISNNLIAEVVAIRLGLEYCRIHNLLPLILETDSLATMKMIEGAWHRPWEVTMEVRRIQILKEGTYFIYYNNFQELPSEAKTILNMDKSQIPNLRIKRIHNGNYAQDR
ncbi:hypothetical protein KY285_007575 [Solanum tuberosum]|nr:hypothetical protein KY285_007575 [Solanum tuberosum]